eukprot:CAMPEP_0202688232 /NCGR_PEP_ID=MMETSP1385-20130828/3768_1 /ASSEMBLY_ACC=CAM_ASM_000861 /TAXON_ID=933848 /ORGANISM="Elphidium margaritaceum" /LENGTH=383 /DNA_ID=CAMNT_0049343155 /DNA_START=33 /DNA_END=1184 /DNA_ORIENTATION=+
MSSVVAFVLSCTILHVRSSDDSIPCLDPDTGADTCSSGEACTAARAKFAYPDPALNFQYGWKAINFTTCTSTNFCSWMGAMNAPCITVHNPSHTLGYPAKEFGCQPITVTIKLNQTLSCCHDGIDCAQVSDNVLSEPAGESPFSGDACPVVDAGRTQLISDIATCYSTDEFMALVSCNSSSFNAKCPDVMFDTYQTYARCACNVIAEYDRTIGEGSEAYKYFRYLTQLVEQTFRASRVHKEDCPPWQFSCNAEGEAILDVYEIRCPLDVDEDSSDLTALREDVYDLVGAKWQWQAQISIDDDLLVFMYSEEDMMNAVNSLVLNTSENVPIEVITEECTLNDEILQNLNEVHGDYTTTKADDSAHQIMFISSTLFVFSWCVVMM